ncbi:MAG: FHA domain-containing protein [Polyangiales bacterium]
MNLELGVVCGSCDAYSPMGTARCASCGHDLALFRVKTASAPPPPPAKSAEPSKSAQLLAQQPSKSPTISPLSKRGEAAPSTQGAPPRSAVQSRPAPPIAPSAAVISKRGSGLMEPGPMSERRLRPQAPDVMPMPGTSPDSSDAPKVEVVRHGESWGHDTSGKIPLKPLAAAQARPGSKGSLVAVSKEELMEQARNYVCRSCQTPIPSGHKFCGRCGAAVPPDILTLREEFYGSLQVPGRAKLILIRAEGDAAMEGLSFALNAQEHIVGRQGHLTFPEDRFVSPKHANLFYRDGKLVVRDEGSLNGVFVRVRGSVDVQAGDLFLAGEQVFRVDATPKATDHPDPDGTYFWSSPKRPSPFRVTQILQGGAPGNVCCAREAGVNIGREGGDMNFPTDVYMSATHAKLEADPSGGRLTLTDLNSRNGTYLRLRQERELVHGDYIFIGKKILRVEVTS